MIRHPPLPRECSPRGQPTGTFEFGGERVTIVNNHFSSRSGSSPTCWASSKDDDRYSFIFDGNSQLLDHIFTTSSMLAGAEFEVVHLNADFRLLLGQVATSDHEPKVARFRFK